MKSTAGLQGSEQTGELIPVDVEVGDTVVYAKYGGTEQAGGEELLTFQHATFSP